MTALQDRQGQYYPSLTDDKTKAETSSDLLRSVKPEPRREYSLLTSNLVLFPL